MQYKRKLRGKKKTRSWVKMNEKLIQKFLPIDYQRIERTLSRVTMSSGINHQSHFVSLIQNLGVIFHRSLPFLDYTIMVESFPYHHYSRLVGRDRCKVGIWRNFQRDHP